MRRLITAEFHKLFTTRLWLWLLLGSVALTALYASLAIAFGDTPDNPTPPLASPGRAAHGVLGRPRRRHPAGRAGRHRPHRRVPPPDGHHHLPGHPQPRDGSC